MSDHDYKEIVLETDTHTANVCVELHPSGALSVNTPEGRIFFEGATEKPKPKPSTFKPGDKFELVHMGEVFVRTLICNPAEQTISMLNDEAEVVGEWVHVAGEITQADIDKIYKGYTPVEEG